MRNKTGMKFDCIFEETLDFIDIDYTHLNKTIRYEQRLHGEWNTDKSEKVYMFVRECLNCKNKSAVGNFCMHCGADMRPKEGGEKE